jgi:hypothetical protein
MSFDHYAAADMGCIGVGLDVTTLNGSQGLGWRCYLSLDWRIVQVVQMLNQRTIKQFIKRKWVDS